MSQFTTVATLEDVPEGGLKAIKVEDADVVLVRRDGRVFALEDRCSHEEFPLSAGEVTGGQITCCLHGARFDLETGAAKALPAVLPVRTYECRVEGDEIQLKL